MKPQIENIETTKKILPLILATAIFMQMLDSTILNTSLPSIAKDLNESPLNMQNAIISYVLTLALFMPVSGFLADKFGTKKVFIISDDSKPEQITENISTDSNIRKSTHIIFFSFIPSKEFILKKLFLFE